MITWRRHWGEWPEDGAEDEDQGYYEDTGYQDYLAEEPGEDMDMFEDLLEFDEEGQAYMVLEESLPQMMDEADAVELAGSYLTFVFYEAADRLKGKGKGKGKSSGKGAWKGAPYSTWGVRRLRQLPRPQKGLAGGQARPWIYFPGSPTWGLPPRQPPPHLLGCAQEQDPVSPVQAARALIKECPLRRKPAPVQRS